MKKRFRLRNNSDFAKVYKKGRSVADKLIVMKYKKTTDSSLRAGFSINKKYGKAVARNKIKRRLKDIVSRRIHLLNPGYDLVFVVRKEAKDARYTDLVTVVESLLKKARILKDV